MKSAPAVVAEIENPNWRVVESLKISKNAFDASHELFVSHENYLSLPTPFAPMRDLHLDLQKRLAQTLINRGEAHITVVTPPEFDVLKTRVSMADINDIAARLEIQKGLITPLCLGVGRATLDGKEDTTYFVVVRAEVLAQLRREISELFVGRGGARGAFAAELFYPHITVGFSKTDLHLQNGVVKGENSCAFPLELD